MKYFILLLTLAACDMPTEAQRAAASTNDIIYVKDSRTNLCFVVSRINSYPIGIDYVYSNVPCSAEVEKLATVK